MILYLDTDAGVITNEYHRVVPLAEARKAWEAGEVEDCSMSFARLANDSNWDIEELRRIYANMDGQLSDKEVNDV